MRDKLEVFKRNTVNGITSPISALSTMIFGFMTFWWGVWVASPFWDAFDRVEVYNGLQRLLPESVWGLIAIIVGVTMLYGGVVSSYKAMSRAVRFGFYFWILVSIYYWLGDWHSTGGVVMSSIAIYFGLAYINLKINRDIVDKSLKNLHYE